MKKTATLTFQNAENYGAILQAYALQKVIISFDLNNEILNYSSEYMGKPYGLSALKRKGLIRYFLGIGYYILRLARKPKFDRFRIEEMNFSKPLNKNDLKNIENKYDAFIVGSDQVWNDSITNLDSAFFLNFVNSPDKKFSYAASFGFEKIEINVKKQYKYLLKDFSAFNMREESGVKIIKSLLNKYANLVLDPTLLLTNKQWKSISIPPKKNNKYILVYQLTFSSLLVKTVKKISNKTGYDIISIPFPMGGFFNSDINIFSGPKEWIGLFSNAEIIVTDSFHGCCFSILFNKKFKVCLTDGVTRIYNLLNMFELESCLIKKDTNFKIQDNINWNKVNNLLEFQRNKSINILKRMLKN